MTDEEKICEALFKLRTLRREYCLNSSACMMDPDGELPKSHDLHCLELQSLIKLLIREGTEK